MLTCSAQTVALNNVYQNSVTFWQNAFRTYPNNPLIFNNLSLAYENEGNYDEEIKMLYKWISYDDKNYIAYIRLGDALEKKSLHEEAVKAYKEAVNLKPGDSEGYVRLGAVYYYTQQYELSYKAYRKALNIDPALSKVRKFLLFMKQAKLIDSATSEDNN